MTPTFSYADLADTMDLDVLGKRARLSTCRELASKGRYPQPTVDRLADQLPKFEAIAVLMRRAADRDKQEEQQQ